MGRKTHTTTDGMFKDGMPSTENEKSVLQQAHKIQDVWVTLCPLKRDAEVLTPYTSEHDLIWK